MTAVTTDCTICIHPRAAEIDAALLGGTPIRTVAGTFDLSRSSVGRHRQNHLSLQAITDVAPTDDAGREPLRIIDVHGQLNALADRLQDVEELAIRTRKWPQAVAAMRERRMTLEAIARLQSDPELQRAASADGVHATVAEWSADFLVAMLDFLIRCSGLEPESAMWARVIQQLLDRADDWDGAAFRGIDTSAVDEWRAEQGQIAEARIAREVQRRVEAELLRRANAARPPLEIDASLPVPVSRRALPPGPSARPAASDVAVAAQDPAAPPRALVIDGEVDLGFSIEDAAEQGLVGYLGTGRRSPYA